MEKSISLSATTRRWLTLFLMLAITGLPILHVWQVGVLFLLLPAMIFASKTYHLKRTHFIIASVIFFGVLALKYLLPLPQIQAGSNLYLPPITPRLPAYTQLPQQVQSTLQQDFFKYYSTAKAKQEPTSWFRSASRPHNTFAFSTESIWQKAKYTRVVHTINFNSLITFNPPFINNLTATLGNYNWYGEAKPSRENAPFFVMYQLPGSLNKSQLCWQGNVMWANTNGTMQSHLHQNLTCQTLAQMHTNGTLYGLSFPQHENLSMQLHLNWPWQGLIWAKSLLGLLLAASLMVWLKPSIKPYCITLTMIAIVLIYLNFYLSGFFHNAPLGGGGDGLTYKAYGAWMIFQAIHGHIAQALSGFVPIFYFMPGMRYVRFVEGFIFADSNLGCLFLLIAFYLLFMHLILKLAYHKWVGFIVVILFALLWNDYRVLALNGSNDIWSFAAILFALYLFLDLDRYTWSAKKFAIAAAMLGIAVFIRPNQCIAAFLLMSYMLYKHMRWHDWRKVILAALPFGLSLLPLLHNLYYGHRFVLFTSAIKVNLAVSPKTYWLALNGLLHGHINTALIQASRHLNQWLSLNGDMPWAVGLIILLTIIGMGFYFKKDHQIRLLAITIIGSQLPFLFFQSASTRYTIFPWNLSIVLIIISIANLFYLRKFSTAETISRSLFYQPSLNAIQEEAHG